MNWLCRLGLHNWRDYGESVVLTWKEPVYKAWRTRAPEHIRSEKVHARKLTKRICLRCGIDMTRILNKNADGTISSVGWKPISQSRYERGKHKEPRPKRKKRRMVR